MMRGIHNKPPLEDGLAESITKLDNGAIAASFNVDQLEKWHNWFVNDMENVCIECNSRCRRGFCFSVLHSKAKIFSYELKEARL